MGKFDIDNILNELGVNDDQPDPKGKPAGGAAGAGPAGAGAAGGGGAGGGGKKRPKADKAPPTVPGAPRHAVDKAQEAFSAIPAVPGGQRSFDRNVTVDHDPAVPVKPKAAPKSTVGQAFSTVYQPETSDQLERSSDLGQFLQSRNTISAQQLTAAQQIHKQTPTRRLAEILIEQGADEVGVQQGVAALAGVPFERIDMTKGLHGGFDGALIQRLGQEFCKEKLVLPLRIESGAAGVTRVSVGATSPDDVFLLDSVRRTLGGASIKLVIVTATDVKAALEVASAAQVPDVDINALLADVEDADVEIEKIQKTDEVDLEKEAGESPVIRYVNHIIQTASKEGASDIHVEPAEKRIKVRFRIDGVLFETMNPPASMAAAIVSRIKIMANLDISERRIPQDGRIRCTVAGRKLDLRVSTLPSTYGEKVVMRILDTRSINVQLEDLGFNEDTLTIWKKAIDEPHGIVLVTGPTGSGKTTTLYSSLRTLDKTAMNISTVEDPVEYHLEGITQTQMHEKIGMTFAKALKALLRQDPDVIMLGEIRDQETAHTAVQAALTGHLVLSTLHTNDAPSSITRLVNIGLEPFLVGAAVRAVLAQRLVRKLCVHCKKQERCSEERSEFLTMHGMDPNSVWVSKGCDRCRQTGYSGRVGIYELLAVDDQLRDIIARNPNVSEFRRICMERGMQTLRQDGMAKAASGKTSFEEILRVTEAT